MNRLLGIVVVVGVVLGSVGFTALLAWQSEVHGVSFNYITGAILILVGAGFTVLNRFASDDYLRRHFGGAENAAKMRKMWKGAWVGVLLGIALIAVQYFLGGGP